MLVTVWSVKGGSGVTVVSAALASVVARREGSSTLVDLAGDQPAVLGLAEPDSPGVHDWLGTGDGTATALGRLRLGVRDDLDLVPSGPVPSASHRWPADRVAALVQALAEWSGPVVVDAGTSDPRRDGPDGPILDRLADAGTSLLVLRPCYLALRRAVARRTRADGIVLLVEPGRALDRRDVADVVGLPVVATVEVDPVVARAVDAGLLARRTPRPLERALRGAA